MKRLTLLFLGLIIGLAHAPLFFDTPRASGQVVCTATAEFIDTNGGTITLAERYFNNPTLQAMRDDNETLDIIINPSQGCIGKNLSVRIQSTSANDGSGWTDTGTQVSFSVPNNPFLQFKIPYLPGNTDCTTGTTCFYRITVFEGSAIVGTSISDGTVLNLGTGTTQNGEFIATPRANTDPNFSNPSYTQRINNVIDNTSNTPVQSSNVTNQNPPSNANPPSNNNNGTTVTLNDPQRPPSQNAQTSQACDSLPADEQEGCYELLAPIPGFGDSVNTNSLGEYINIVFQIGLGIAGVLAILMIIYAGVKYMTTDAASAKSEGKKLITNAFFGLGVILSAFIFLNTINPDLLNLEPELEGVDITFNPNVYPGDPDPGTGTTESFTVTQLRAYSSANSLGLNCPGTGGVQSIRDIALSFQNKTTYRLGGKGAHPTPSRGFSRADAGKSCPNDTICLDCSGYVRLVRLCAGMGLLESDGGTSGIFDDRDAVEIETITLNNNQTPNDTTDDTVSIEYDAHNLSTNRWSWNSPRILQPGDLIGSENWHVFIYIGNGEFAEVTADNNGRDDNEGMQIRDVSQMNQLLSRRGTLKLRWD